MNQQGPEPYGSVPQQAAGQQQGAPIPGYFSPAAPPPGYAQVPQTISPPQQYHPASQPFHYAAAPVQNQRALPLPGATLGKAVGRYFRRYATFSGRASRSEFWWVQLFHAMVLFGAAMLSTLVGADFLAGLYGLFLLGCFMPTLALSVRRLHDANLSGAMALLFLVPYVGFLVVAVLAMLSSSPRGARFDRTPEFPQTPPRT